MNTKFYTIVIFEICYCYAVYSRNICGPRRKGEECVPIRNCPKIFNFTEGTLSPEIVRKLQRITCGFDGNDPKICCPPEASLTYLSKSSESQQLRLADNAFALITHPNLKLLPTLEKCGSSSVTTSDYIFGGKTPALGSYPWLGRIGYSDKKARSGISYFCGGTIINENYILTAAHCSSDFEAHRLFVTLGEHDARQDPEYSAELGAYSSIHIYKVDKILIHPGYNPSSKQNDIALMRLESSIHLTDFIKPICLPISRNDLNSSGFAEIAGWGRTKENVTEGSEILQTVQVPIVNLTKCQEIYKRKTTITSNQICAGSKAGEDSCDGDSGGPLMVHDENLTKYFQIGVVSFGPSQCGIEGYPGIYTNINSFLNWILDSLQT